MALSKMADGSSGVTIWRIWRRSWFSGVLVSFRFVRTNVNASLGSAEHVQLVLGVRCEISVDEDGFPSDSTSSIRSNDVVDCIKWSLLMIVWAGSQKKAYKNELD
jgi:hypothetical protein